MKDALGHGSEAGAHSAGVEAAVAPKIYAWTPMPHGAGHILAVNGNYVQKIGSVTKQTDPATRKNTYLAKYEYAGSTGNANSGWAIHKSSTGAKSYVEKNLAKFWEPPKVQK